MLLAVVLRSALAVLLALVWEGIRLLNGAAWSWEAVGWRILVAGAALNLSAWAVSQRRRCFAVLGLSFLFCVAASWWDLRQVNTGAAWCTATGLYTLVLIFESAFAERTHERSGLLARLEYVAGLLSLGLVGGVTPVVLAQVESRFAEEEFFVGVQAAFLCLFALLLLLVQVVARRLDPSRATGSCELRPVWGMVGMALIGVAFGWWTVRAYQASFYTPTAPAYDGVSAGAPFLCAPLAPAPGTPDGQQVFQRIQALVEGNPRKSVPEYGMLALMTGEQRWADAFREGILAEAEVGRFTEPANSVKYGQRLAARRAYYLTRIQKQFPQLFSNEELKALKSWFAAVNRRAMTVEWVDLLYGLAFSVWPEGPYENQENGAGLLALLESGGLSDSELSEANRNYLARNVRGWVERFRNTDDAYLYQAEWIDNALFQELYEGSGFDSTAFERNRRLAFEWLLLQTLPGGAPLTYNRPGELPLANVLYLGALLLDDPRYVWAADQSLTNLESKAGYLYAQPGLERPVDFQGASPTEGTCLLFSPSGLPTQVGPLAPDKIVFRDGWADNATYLLLNLRFTGWHRYKGTNGIVMLYQDGPIVVEDHTGEPFAWLPTGRSLFRDKRIPRENLNGFLIPRSGFSQVVYSISGLYGPWAQDPPHHARVENFHQLDLLDASHTSIDDWRGWEHTRTIYFLHQGPVIVVDSAENPAGGESALTWHVDGLGEQTAEGVWLRRGDSAVRLALPDADWGATTVEGSESNSNWDVTYLAPDSGRLDLVTAFLMNGWAEAAYEVRAVEEAGEPIGQYVHVRKGDEEMRLLHNALPGAEGDGRQDVQEREPLGVIAASGLRTDGLALLVLGNSSGRPHTVCAVGGSQSSVATVNEPRDVRLHRGRTSLVRGEDWEWEGGTMTLWPSPKGSTCLDIDY